MALPHKKRASSPKYASPSQTVLVGFECPFSQKLDPNNRWILLAHRIPWDKIVGQYNKQMSDSSEKAVRPMFRVIHDFYYER